MLYPKEVFENFEASLAHFCAPDDAEVEGQYFDRKEACRPRDNGLVARGDLNDLRGQIVECVSAFANTNQLGGLLVIGIASDGTLCGIDHLADEQRLSLLNLRGALRNHAAQANTIECTTMDGQHRTVLLIYAPYTSDAICETPESTPRSWRRNGSRNDPLDERGREQLRRDKHIVDYESSAACRFDPGDLDDGLLREVRATWLSIAGTSLSDEELLYELGALTKSADGAYFTRSGLLFFAANPQRVMDAARIRLLRYECSVNDADENRGKPSLDKRFDGPLTKQIRDFRSVVKESSLFRVFQVRRPDGGFEDQPELPPVAIDEAVVNAIAHRDYAENWPVECLYFRDAFVVRNAGRLIQRNESVPAHFSLADQKLTHTPRNPKLFDWLKQMRTPSGAEFVRALSEGTRTMRSAMGHLGLPPPSYDVTAAETMVTLLSEPERRLAAERESEAAVATEFTNLYPIQLRRRGSPTIGRQIEWEQRREFLTTLRDALLAHDWFVDSLKYGQLTAHRRGDFRSISAAVDQVVRLFPAYSLSVRDFFDRIYLCIDFKVEVKNALKASELSAHVPVDELVGASAIAKLDSWQRGRIVEGNTEWLTLRLFDFDHTLRVASANVIPDLPVRVIKGILLDRGITFDLSRSIKQLSLSATTGAARIRAENTQALAEQLARSVFPLRVFGIEATIATTPLALLRDERQQDGLQVRTLAEPKVEFGHHQETPDVRDGITKFGAYSAVDRMIEIVPIVAVENRDQMAGLIERLKSGRYKYRGSERTFHTRFTYGSIVTVARPSGIVEECRRLLTEHPDWAGDDHLSRLFLVHTPELGFALDDATSPYFAAKRFLLESGVPCQMVDTPTLVNPDWKDLNLALNLVAKCGVTPWVLPEGMPDADFFVGLSYTQSRVQGTTRLMGYANVFNEYGRWLFYSGNTQAFPYEERATRLSELVRQTLERMKLSETPNIYFHYSARFSREDRDAIVAAARSVRKDGVYTFVWINTHHPVRLYDQRPETDGSLARGNYVIGSANQVFVSTTGYNPYRKAMGTPIMLEVNARRSYPAQSPAAPIDLKALAMQILSLTKLNWSSTDSLCGEPITTKYAGDIAYLTASFLRQNGVFKLHQVLEQTPWFI